MKLHHRAKFNLDKLVVEMLGKIPEEIFISSTTTFLDPAFAGGQFLVEIINKLKTYGHSDDNIKSRVFGYEDNIWYILYGRRNQCLHLANLDVKLYTEFFEDKKLPKFDVVIGNPPYNNNSNSKSEALWKKFIIKSETLLNINGIMSLVCPPGWKDRLKTYEKIDKSAKQLNNVFNKNDILFINLHECKKYFNVGSLFSYFILRKSKTPGLETKIISLYNGSISENKLNIDNFIFIPNDISKIGLSIINKVLFSKFEKLDGFFNEITGYRVGSKIISTEKTENFKYKISNTSAQYTKNIFLFSSIKQKIQSKSKIIFSDSGYPKPYFDNGEIGLGHHSRCIFIDNKQSQLYLNYLNSDLIKYIFISTKTSSGSAVDWPLVAHLLPKPKSDDFYKDFNLTQEEIDYIEENV